MTFLALMPGWLRSALIGAAIGFTAFAAGHWHGASTATAQAEARGAQATISQLKERGLINEAVRNVDDCALVRELGGVCQPEP